MIRLPATDSLSPIERHGLSILVDLSRLLPAAAAEVVSVTIHEGGPRGVEGLRSSFEGADGTVRIGRTLLATIGEIASASAERATPRRDRLGRVPSDANALVASGAEGEPLISSCAARFRVAAAQAAGRRTFRTLAPWPDGKRWAAALTHDLDVVALWPAFSALRLVELAGKGEWAQLFRSLTAATAATFGRPILDCVRDILAVEREFGARSSWYILCGTPTLTTWRAGDLTYRPESAATRRILAEVTAGGHEVGLHGSLATAVDPALFAEQRRRLMRLVPSIGTGVRQHFLRMEPGETQRGMASAGFEYDATWGFADRNGFRLGVADVIPWFDGEGKSPRTLDAVPFCWMDRTQSKYQGVEDPSEWARVALERAAACRAVEGVWSGIWHPNLTAALGYPRAPEAYRTIVRGLAAWGDGWLAPVGEIVAWRRQRRAARATGITTDGRVEVTAPAGGATLVLEDADGRAREQVRA